MSDEIRIPSLSPGNAAPMELRELNREPLRRVATFDYAAAVRAAKRDKARQAVSAEGGAR